MANLLFNKESVNLVKDHLARLMRVIFYRNKIDNDQFLQWHFRYFGKYHSDHRSLATNRNNLRRAMAEQQVTWKHFQSVIRDLLYFDLVRVSITLRHPMSLKEYTYSSDDDVSIPDPQSPEETTTPFGGPE